MTIARGVFRCFLALAAIAVAIPGSALAKPGDLDPGFGAGGRVMSALNFYGSAPIWLDVAADPGGGIVAFAGDRVLRYLPNGSPDLGFSQQGALPAGSVAGREFRLESLAVDAQGRIVLGGIVRGLGEVGERDRAAVMRFDPDGSPDRAFGGGDGAVVTDLGFTMRPGFGAPGGGPAPIAEMSGLTIDPAGRIVLAGRATVSFGGYCEETAGFVARLTSAGDLDTGFAGTGVVVQPDGLDAIYPLALDRSGAPLFSGFEQTDCHGGRSKRALFRVDANGLPDLAFGGSGHARSGPGPMAIAVDRAGRVLVLGNSIVNEPFGAEPGSVYLLRLLPSGAPDRRFGQKGKVDLQADVDWADMALTRKGGAVIAGTLTPEPGAEGGQVAITELDTHGAPSPRFGKGGLTLVGRKGTRSLTGRRVVLDGRGHAIVAGTVRSRGLSTGEGLALFRFDL